MVRFLPTPGLWLLAVFWLAAALALAQFFAPTPGLRVSGLRLPGLRVPGLRVVARPCRYSQINMIEALPRANTTAPAIAIP